MKADKAGLEVYPGPDQHWPHEYQQQQGHVGWNTRLDWDLLQKQCMNRRVIIWPAFHLKQDIRVKVSPLSPPLPGRMEIIVRNAGPWSAWDAGEESHNSWWSISPDSYWSSHGLLPEKLQVLILPLWLLWWDARVLSSRWAPHRWALCVCVWYAPVSEFVYFLYSVSYGSYFQGPKDSRRVGGEVEPSLPNTNQTL